MTIEITGINLSAHPKWSAPLTIVAFCDVRLRGMSTTLFGVALARSKGKWVALPPKAAGARPNDPGVIKWDISGPVPRAIAEAMLARYIAFGGPVPDGSVARIDDKRESAIAAAKAGQIERRVFPFELVDQEEPVEPDFDPPIITEQDIADDWNDEEAVAGLHRFIGTAESEICDRAGL